MLHRAGVARSIAGLAAGALLALAAAPPAASRHPAAKVFTLHQPGKAWSLVVDLRGIDLARPSRRPDGTGVRVHGRNRHADLTVAVFMDRAEREGDALVCRKHYWKLARKSPLPKSDVVLSERDGMALVEYSIPEFQGVPLQQKNLNAYMVRDDVWIVVQISKGGYGPQDDLLFEKILRSVRFREPARRRA
jgi:hypothetical protein